MSTQHQPSNPCPLATHQESVPGEVKAIPTTLSHEVTPLYWVNAETGRYYAARLLINLFGQWELEQAWGSLSSRRGRLRYVPMDCLTEGQTQLQRLARRRLQRGYVATGPACLGI